MDAGLRGESVSEGISTFVPPGLVHFGPGAAGKAGQEARRLGGTKALLVTDPGVLATGIVDHVCESLRNAQVDCVVFDAVDPSPLDVSVAQGCEVADSERCDVLVAVGGGSAIDVAKAIGLLRTHDGTLAYYETAEGAASITEHVSPLIAIPTTAGTGSEVTTWSVITDSSRSQKMGIGSRYLIPPVALADPVLTKSLPSDLTAQTGVDALTHAVEALTASACGPMARQLALSAVGLIAVGLRKAVDDGSDLAARSDMLLASMFAGIAFTNSDLGAVHCMSETIGPLVGLPHGLANALFLSAVVDFNAGVVGDVYAAIADRLRGQDTSVDNQDETASLCGIIATLVNEVGIPRPSEVGVTPERYDEFAAACVSGIEYYDNPRAVSHDDFVDILKAAEIRRRQSRA